VQPVEWLTLGLVVFAAVQVWLQFRTEQVRVRERRQDLDEELDRAFHYAWAEHFRFESLADGFERFDLIELALLDVLRPGDVLPKDTVEFVGALAQSSREAGVLAGIAVGACQDVERLVAIFVRSVQAFAKEAPAGLKEAEKPAWLRSTYGAELEPWESSIRKLIKQVSLLMWDAAKHNPRARVEHTLDFSDDFDSDLARSTVGTLVERSKTLIKSDDG
jgi:hypothetical protein